MTWHVVSISFVCGQVFGGGGGVSKMKAKKMQGPSKAKAKPKVDKEVMDEVRTSGPRQGVYVYVYVYYVYIGIIVYL